MLTYRADGAYILIKLLLNGRLRSQTADNYRVYDDVWPVCVYNGIGVYCYTSLLNLLSQTAGRDEMPQLRPIHNTPFH